MQFQNEVSVLNRGQQCLPDQAMAALGMALFDEIDHGLIVCDAQGEVRFVNHAAQLELASQRLLLRSANTLCRADGSSSELDAALRQAVQRSRRCLVRLAHAGDQLIVAVMPFQPPGVGERFALVILGRRQPCSELGLELLAGSHGLTWMERRVLGALLRQASPAEIAAAHDVQLCTVRTQIASIRAKFGARSVEDVLLLVAQLPPVANALRLAAVAGASGASDRQTPWPAAA